MDDPEVRSRFRETAEAINRLLNDDVRNIAGFLDYDDLNDLSRGLGRIQTVLGDEIGLQMLTNCLLPALRTLASADHDTTRLRNNLNAIFPPVPPPPGETLNFRRRCYSLRCASPLTVLLWSLALELDEWRGLPSLGFDCLLRRAAGLNFTGNLPDIVMRVAALHRGRTDYASTDFFGCEILFSPDATGPGGEHTNMMDLVVEAWEAAHGGERRRVGGTRVRFATDDEREAAHRGRRRRAGGARVRFADDDEWETWGELM